MQLGDKNFELTLYRVPDYSEKAVNVEDVFVTFSLLSVLGFSFASSQIHNKYVL